jgi:TIR domain-containing protein
MTVAEGGGILLATVGKSSHLAGRLSDRLADRFGEGQVFIDVDAIEPGVDFAEAISRAVAVCQVLLADCGPTWLTATDQRGGRRLDDPDDIVRLEIEAALARGVRVIPILVEGAVMPGRDDLPESLVGLARRNALLIRHESFRSDAGRLVSAIERVLAAPGSAAAPALPTLTVVSDLLEMLLARWLSRVRGRPETTPTAPPGSSPRPNASPTPSPTRA